jgi:CBS domain-containing protein/ribosome-associated translation inhibitor RaiA
MALKELMKTDFVAVNEDEPITALIGKLKQTKEKAAVIVDSKGKYKGITKKSFLYRANIDTSKTKVKSVGWNCPSAGENDSVEKAAGLMYNSDSRLLPVTKEGKVLGVVHSMAVIANLKAVPQLKEMKAEEVASKKILTIPFEANIGQALNLMRENKINRLPVVDANNNLMGLVSFREIMKNHLLLPAGKEQASPRGTRQSRAGVETEKPGYLKIPVNENMIEDVKTASPSQRLDKTIDRLTKSKGSQVILVEEGRPIGIITPRDILKVFLLSRQGTRNIHFTGLPELDEIDRKIVENNVTESYDKLERIANNEIDLSIHVKSERTSGARKKYQVNAKLSGPGINFNASKITGWKLLTAIQDAMKAIEREMVDRIKRRRD